MTAREIDDGGPAFPISIPGVGDNGSGGMSLRDWFAGQALAGLTLLAAAKLRWLEADPKRLFAEERLNEAADQLRVALNLCEDTARTLKNSAVSQHSEAGDAE